MLKLDDARWEGLQGGYRVPFDPRPLLVHLQLAPEDAGLWGELIEGLYHQGNVGEASYASIPVMVSFAVALETMPWQMLALVASIEIARTEEDNPPVPEWLEDEYSEAMTTLVEECMKRLPEVEIVEVARGMLSLISLWKGFPVFARTLLDYSEEELAQALPG